MVNMTNREMRTEVVRIAIIFLVVGLLLGGGAALCILDFTPVGAVTMRVFSSIAVIFGALLAVVAAVTLTKLGRVLVPSGQEQAKARLIEITKEVEAS